MALALLLASDPSITSFREVIRLLEPPVREADEETSRRARMTRPLRPHE